MPTPQKDPRGSRAYMVPLFGIVFMLASYWLLTDWQHLPQIIDTAIATMHWPVY